MYILRKTKNNLKASVREIEGAVEEVKETGAVVVKETNTEDESSIASSVETERDDLEDIENKIKPPMF